MKKFKIIFIVIFWIMLVVYINSKDIDWTNIDSIRKIIGSDSYGMKFTFIFISIIRVYVFVPQTVLIIFGGIIFGPYEGFLLSIISLFLSQSMNYLIGTGLKTKDITKNKSKYITLLKKYRYKLLAIGIACPITPSDLIVIIAGYIKLNYKKAILVIVLADIPLIFLYSYLGGSFDKSIIFKIITIASIIVILYYTISIWKKIQSQVKEDSQNTI